MKFRKDTGAYELGPEQEGDEAAMRAHLGVAAGAAVKVEPFHDVADRLKGWDARLVVLADGAPVGYTDTPLPPVLEGF